MPLTDKQKLELLSPAPFYIHSWWMHTYQFGSYYDNDYLYEYARLTHSIGVSGKWATSDIIDKSVQICKRVNDNKSEYELECVICVNFSPFYEMWKYYNSYYEYNPSLQNPSANSVPLLPQDNETIFDISDGYNIYNGSTLVAAWRSEYADYVGLTVHEAEMSYFENKLITFKGYLDTYNATYGTNVRIGALFLDSEYFSTYNQDQDYIDGLKDKHDEMHRRLLAVLGAPENPSDPYTLEGVEVLWYQREGQGTNWTDLENFDISTFSTKTYHAKQEASNLMLTSLYWPYWEKATDAYMYASDYYLENDADTPVDRDKICPVLSLCSGYIYKPFIESGNAQYKMYLDYDVNISYRFGRKIAGEKIEYKKTYIPILYPAPFSSDYDDKESATSYDKVTVDESGYPITWEVFDPVNNPSTWVAPETDWIDHFIEFIQGINDGENSIYERIEADDVFVLNGVKFVYLKLNDGEECTLKINTTEVVLKRDGSLIVWDYNGPNEEILYNNNPSVNDVWRVSKGSYNIDIYENNYSNYLFVFHISNTNLLGKSFTPTAYYTDFTPKFTFSYGVTTKYSFSYSPVQDGNTYTYDLSFPLDGVEVHIVLTKTSEFEWSMYFENLSDSGIEIYDIIFPYNNNADMTGFSRDSYAYMPWGSASGSLGAKKQCSSISTPLTYQYLSTLFCYAPYIMFEEGNKSIIVYATNWRPRITMPYVWYNRISMRYHVKNNVNTIAPEYDEEGLSPGEATTFSFAAKIFTGEEGYEPWQIALDDYKTWLDGKKASEGIPLVFGSEWLKESHGYMHTGLMNISDYNASYETLFNTWETYKDTANWIQVWGQMSDYAGTCCGFDRDMHPRYYDSAYLDNPSVSSYIDFAYGVVNIDGGHQSYYTRPTLDENGNQYYMVPIGSEEKYYLDDIKDWMDKNRDEYNANVHYLDTLEYADPSKAIEDIHYMMDNYDDFFMERGRIISPFPALTTYNDGDLASGCPYIHRFLQNKQYTFGGVSNGSYLIRGESNDYQSERYSFLTGSKFEFAIQTAPHVNTLEFKIVEERDRVGWWDR